MKHNVCMLHYLLLLLRSDLRRRKGPNRKCKHGNKEVEFNRLDTGWCSSASSVQMWTWTQKCTRRTDTSTSRWDRACQAAAAAARHLQIPRLASFTAIRPRLSAKSDLKKTRRLTHGRHKNIQYSQPDVLKVREKQRHVDESEDRLKMRIAHIHPKNNEKKKQLTVLSNTEIWQQRMQVFTTV